MNDEQLIRALRALDRPVTPDPAFGDALFMSLRQPVQPRETTRWQLLLVAALLATAAIATAVAIGTGSFRPDRLFSDATTPAPAPSTPAYTVAVPEGATPQSRPEDVERAVLGLAGRFGLPAQISAIDSMTWTPPDTDVPVSGGGAIASGDPSWAVVVVGGDGSRIVTLIDDATLTTNVSDRAAGDEPVPSSVVIQPLPARNPDEPLRLTGPDGRTVTPTLVDVPDAASLPMVGRLIPAGDIIWAIEEFIYTEDPPRLLRVDTRSSEITTVPLTSGRSGPLVAGVDSLWQSADGAVRRLDPISGDVLATIPAPADASPVGEDEDGLWLRDIGGIVLVDPETGQELRRIESVEEENTAPYRGFWNMPAFGDLWDFDHQSGEVLRVHPVTGETVARIPIDPADSAGCLDPEPLTGVAGLDGVVLCGMAVIDPAINEVIRTLEVPANHVAANGAWWAFELPQPNEEWQVPGTVEQIDPHGDGIIAQLRFSLERTAGWGPVVVGDALWFVVGERAADNQGYDHNLAFARVPLAELAD